LWLLLHFEDIQAPLHRKDVERRLKLHMPGYEKGEKGSFHATKAQLPVASARAERLAERFSAHTDPEPFTTVAGLVKLLMGLRRT
jgi:hypothetical protein